MLLRQPFVNRRRQKEPGLAVDRPEVAHRRNVLEKRAKRALILSGPSYGVKSDRLLADWTRSHILAYDKKVAKYAQARRAA